MKHAYLIMAHNDFYILEKLLLLLDDNRNDIYVHIDKKVKNFNFSYYKKIIKFSNLYFTERTDVRWGTYSQINCEMILFKTAQRNGKYQYYHLLSGADLPLKSQDEIHDFFDKNNGKEFICYDNHKMVSQSVIDRVKYYHIFLSQRRMKNSCIKKIYNKIYFWLLKMEKMLQVDRLKKCEFVIQKGANWISITNDLVNYLIGHEDKIRKMFKYTLCADEVFVQTLVYNSKMYQNLYNYHDNDYQAIQRYIDWNRGEPYVFTLDDYDELINSNCLFARKFSTLKDQAIIDKIYNHLKKDYELVRGNSDDKDNKK